MKKSNFRFIIYILLIVVAVVLLVKFIGGRAIEVSTGDFYTWVTTGEAPEKYDGYTIKSVTVDGYTVNFKATKEVEGKKYSKEFTANILRTDSDNMDLKAAYEAAKGTELEFKLNATDPNARSIWSSLLTYLGIPLLFLIVIFFIFRQTQGGGKSAFDFSKTNARMQTNTKTKFTDVAGAEEEKEELAEVVEFLKNPKKFSDLGARIPRGVLLVGPPGTGKTLFAKAVAGEAGVPFFTISGSDFVEMFVGVGASRVRDLFNLAKKNMPCILFIDEIDAVGRQRGTGMGGGNDEREQTLNQLLVQMDGFETNDGIIIMAATNRVDILDPALLRPGRFDRQIYINLPDVKGREGILKVHSRNKPLAPDVSLKTIARMTTRFSGADLENLLNEAAIFAARAGRKFITNLDLYEGINKVLMGPQKKSRLVTESEKRLTAYHEAGHAILAKILPNCDPVTEVTIIPRGMAGGYTKTTPEKDVSYMSLQTALDDITMTLGGRVAEELVLKDISSGASSDIKQASKLARAMVTEWGMSEKVGPISYSSDGEVFIGRDMASHINYSEAKAADIDSEIERIIKECLERARKLLKENRAVMDKLVRVLIERETVFQEEFDMIMSGSSVEEVIAFMDKSEKQFKDNPFAKRDVVVKESDVKTSDKTTDEKEETVAEKVETSDEKVDSEKPFVDDKTSDKEKEDTADDTDGTDEK